MNFDVVVVGSGIAGLSFALKTAKLGHKVAIVTKKSVRIPIQTMRRAALPASLAVRTILSRMSAIL